jgi:hypothetical protein
MINNLQVLKLFSTMFLLKGHSIPNLINTLWFF